MNIPVLGAARFPSPLKRWVNESERVPATILRTADAQPDAGLLFELAGPRKTLFFHSPETRVGIVTCGGLCPGLNDVIRSLFFEMHHAYGVKEVLGFRWGYQGLDPQYDAEPLVLTHEIVDRIHLQAGTILGTSRGPVDKARAVENLIRRRINILFTIGGDGTQRGLGSSSRRPKSVVTRSPSWGSQRPSITISHSLRAHSVSSPRFRRPPRCCSVRILRRAACKTASR